MSRIKVLLVDDSKLAIEINKSFLERADVTILTAETGNQALEQVRNHRPHLVFLDLHLPDISGDKVCQTIKSTAELADTKLIIATADDRDEAIAAVKRAGCDGILTKPFQRTEFVSTLQKTLGIAARTQPRIDTRIDCIMRVGELGHVSTILNLSVLGAYTTIDPPPGPGTSVEIAFAVPPLENPFELSGVVKWTSDMVEQDIPPGVGIAFLNPPPHIREIIEEFVESSL